MAFSCFYFNGNGSDLSDQTLVIRREGESNCVLNITTTHVSCVGNATATRVNTTDILLKASDNLDVKFMEYGRVNEAGELAEPIAADCPNSPDLLEAEKNLDGHPLQPYIIGGAVVLTIILCLITFFIYKKYENKRRSQIKCNGYSVTFTKCSNKEDTRNGQEKNGPGQAGPQGAKVDPLLPHLGVV
ncbi:uncharacterized protein LOC143770516 [Ranitomeya variabilis]|uniref:uncharacterized protein LOC143770516 n=1 Tax=Ranitomeya variabilis TaxID=490064 RepID=UPI00405796E8